MVLASQQGGQLRDGCGQRAIAEGDSGCLADREICVLQALPQSGVGPSIMKIGEAAYGPPAMIRRGRPRELQERGEGRQSVCRQGGKRALRAQVIP